MSGRWQQTIAEFFTIFRFAIVGVVATAVHMAVALVLHNLAGLAPLPANVLAFATAVLFSFVGHSYWTFRDHGAELKYSAARFFIVAISGFLLNNAILWVLVEKTALGGSTSIIFAALVVPPMTYLLSKLWAFRA
jgi:putative flippase GtrA